MILLFFLQHAVVEYNQCTYTLQIQTDSTFMLHAYSIENAIAINVSCLTMCYFMQHVTVVCVF